MLMYPVPLPYIRTNSLHNRGKMCQPCHPAGSIVVNPVYFTIKDSHSKYAHNHNTETETPNQGGLAHLPSGNARPLCTAGAFFILFLTTKVPTGLKSQLPNLSFPFPPCPLPLAVFHLYLPLCAPSQPIETIKTPCMGEGV